MGKYDFSCFPHIFLLFMQPEDALSLDRRRPFHRRRLAELASLLINFIQQIGSLGHGWHDVLRGVLRAKPTPFTLLSAMSHRVQDTL